MREREAIARMGYGGVPGSGGRMHLGGFLGRAQVADQVSFGGNQLVGADLPVRQLLNLDCPLKGHWSAALDPLIDRGRCDIQRLRQPRDGPEVIDCLLKFVHTSIFRYCRTDVKALPKRPLGGCNQPLPTTDLKK